MKKTLISAVLVTIFATPIAYADSPFTSITKSWTYNHANTGVNGLLAEISAYDYMTNTIWVAGVKGVDVLNANNGTLLQHIDTTSLYQLTPVPEPESYALLFAGLALLGIVNCRQKR
jgi:hypothetical protein